MQMILFSLVSPTEPSEVNNIIMQRMIERDVFRVGAKADGTRHLVIDVYLAKIPI